MIQDFFKANIAVLRMSNAELADRITKADQPDNTTVQASHSGVPTMVVAGQTFHSRVDPWAEACKIVDASVSKRSSPDKMPLVFGLGLGYHVIETADRFEQVIVFEPDIGMIRLAFSCLDYQPVMHRLEFMTEITTLPTPDRVFIVAHWPSIRRNRRIYDSWLKLRSDTLAETTGQLRDAWHQIEGADILLAGQPEKFSPSLDELTRAAAQGQGPLSELEIYLLLMRELGNR